MSDKADSAAAFNKTKEELLAMDGAGYRTRFRERCHHTLEIQVYANAYRGKQLSSEQPKTARHFMKVRRGRGSTEACPCCVRQRIRRSGMHAADIGILNILLGK